MQLPPTPPASSISEHFLADHRRLDALMDQVLEAFADNDRELVAKLWSAFDAGLLAHLDAEEKYMIPVILRASERDARILIQEHKHIRTQLAELGIGIDLHVVRLEVVRTFIDELHAHATHEDALLYQRADAALDETERQSLFAGLADNVRVRLARKKTVV